MSNYFYLDLSDDHTWLIKSKDGKRYFAGHNKDAAQNLVNRLNTENPHNLYNDEANNLLVCWDNHKPTDMTCGFNIEILG